MIKGRIMKFKINNRVKLSGCPFDEQMIEEMTRFYSLKDEIQIVTELKETTEVGTSGQWIKTNLMPDWTDAAWFKLNKTKTKMKLFIWTEFSPDYSDGLAFAIAKDEPEARKLIEKEYGFSPSNWGTLEVRILTRKIARCVSGGG